MPDAVPFRLHPEAWLLGAVLLGLYFGALRAWGPQEAPGRPPASRAQRTQFVLGTALLWLGTEWPIHDLAEDYLYGVHMAQHLLFQFVAPPLLLMGMPAWLWRRLLRPAWLHRTVAALIRPLPAILVVNTFVAVTHTPWWVNTSVASEPFHLAAHVALVTVSLLMWWPVLSPLPELPHYSYPGRMAYLFTHSIVPTVPASFLTFTSVPLYASYTSAPRLVPFLDPLQDQQIAGLLMKIGGGLILWAAIAVLFFRWAHEEQQGGPDYLYWRDLELTLPTTTESTAP